MEKRMKMNEILTLKSIYSNNSLDNYYMLMI